MVLSFIRLKLKQTMGGEGIRGIIKFLAPDLLVGAFLAFSAVDVMSATSFGRLYLVSMGVALFTLIVETRKFFYSSGDLERFYFVQPTVAFRVSSAVVIAVVDVIVILSLALPFLLINPYAASHPQQMAAAIAAAAFTSFASYLIIVLVIASAPRRIMNLILTLLQVFTAIALVGMFQLSTDLRSNYESRTLIWIFAAASAVLLLIPLCLPVFERLQEHLNTIDSRRNFDLVSLSDHVRSIIRLGGDEERAGFILLLSNLLRNSSFRLSTIAVASTPVMVAVYWSVRHARIVDITTSFGPMQAELIAPFASVVVSGILVHYFLSQGILSSRNSEATWSIRINAPFDSGKFVAGVRKAMLVCVQLPMSCLIFLVVAFNNNLAVSCLAALTFFSLTQTSAIWFSVMQRSLPFSVPYSRVGPVEGANLVFMFSYSFVVCAGLLFTFTRVGSLLMLNVFAFIFMAILVSLSRRIVNRRIRLIV